MVPSLPLWLKVPEMPNLLCEFAAWFASRVESSRFSISPAPNVGVGIRTIKLLYWPAVLKLGCGRLQDPASDRPVTVKRFSTPPFGALKFGVPLPLKKKGNLASTVGPFALRKYGTVSAGAVGLPANANSGLTGALDPPRAG